MAFLSNLSQKVSKTFCLNFKDSRDELNLVLVMMILIPLDKNIKERRQLGVPFCLGVESTNFLEFRPNVINDRKDKVI